MNHFPVVCMIGSALSLYFLAALFYSGELHSRRRFHGRIATTLTGLGLISHTGAIVVYSARHGGFPALFANLFGTFLFFGWVLVGVYLMVERAARTKALGAVVLPVALFTMLIGTILRPGAAPLDGALRGQVIVLHVMAILVGYASFAVAFCAAVLYLVEHRMLKRKRLGGVFQKLPPLDRSDALAARMVILGFPLLTLGLALGVFRAEIAVGHAWLHEPKVLSSLLVWLIYGTYLVSRNCLGWTGKRTNYLLIVGFAMIIAAYIGGLAIGGGLHGIHFLQQGRHL